MKHFLTLVLLLSTALPAFAATKAQDLFQVGQIYARQKMYKEAADTYTEVIKLDKKHEQAYVALAIIYSVQKKFKVALKTLDTVMKIYPKAYVPYKVKGMILKDMKKNAEAIVAFETYLKKAPPKKIRDKKDLEALILVLKKGK